MIIITKTGNRPSNIPVITVAGGLSIQGWHEYGRKNLKMTWRSTKEQSRTWFLLGAYLPDHCNSCRTAYIQSTFVRKGSTWVLSGQRWAEHLPSPRMGHSSYNSNLNELTESSCLSQPSLGSIVSSPLPCSDWSRSPPDAMASSNPWCTMCGKGRHPFALWVRGSRTGGNAAGPGTALEAWPKRSCCHSWRYCWGLGCRLQRCFGDFRHPKGGLGSIWIRIWRCMGCWGRRMQLFLWSMTGTGGTGKKKESWKMRGRMLLCWPMLHKVRG